jgi:hypothetical protein
MNTFDERMAFGGPHQNELRAWFYAAGWDIAPGKLTPRLLRLLPVGFPAQYAPDWLVARSGVAVFVDAKSQNPKNRNTPFYSIEAAALQAYLAIEAALRLPVVVMFPGGFCNRVSRLDPGEVLPGVGPGRTPYRLVRKASQEPWAAFDQLAHYRTEPT